MRVEDKKLRVKATEAAMASATVSLENSSFEGKKFWDGSNVDAMEEREDSGLRFGLGFGRFFEVEDIDKLIVLCRLL